MRNVQFGMMEDKLAERLDLLRVSLCNELGKIVKNVDVLEFMITASKEKISNPRYAVFAYDEGNAQGGMHDLIGYFKEIPSNGFDTELDSVDVYDLVKKEFV